MLEKVSSWQLDQIFNELSHAKSQLNLRSFAILSKREWSYVLDLLEGLGPSEIANRHLISEGTVRDVLSEQIYPYIRYLSQQKTGNIANLRGWTDVPNILELLGFKGSKNGLMPSWKLDQIYTDLSNAKSQLMQRQGMILSNRERLYLLDLLEGLSPVEIARRHCVAFGSVRSMLCKSIYPYARHLFKQKTGHEAKLKRFYNVISVLEELGYKT